MVGILLYIIKIEMELEKSESLRLTIQALTLLCKDNYYTQGQLFVSHHLSIFRDLHQAQPLITTIAMTNIFENDNQILYTNPEIFNILFEMYKDLFSEFESYFVTREGGNPNSTPNNEKTHWVISLYTYNKYFLHLLSNPTMTFDSNKMPSYDLIIQQFLTQYLTKYILPVLKNQNFLNKKSNDDQYDYIPKLQNQFPHKNATLSLSDLTIKTQSEQKGLQFDLAVSFLRLYNKASSRLIYGNSVTEIQKVIGGLSNPIENLDYLNSVKHGLIAKKEYLNLKMKFEFFYPNYAITNREQNNKMPEGTYMERLTLSPAVSDSIKSLILSELNSLKVIEDLQSKLNLEANPKKKKQELGIIDEYFYHGLLPIIYIYAKNIQTTFFINNKRSNKLSLQNYRSAIKEVFKKFNEVSYRLSAILRVNFSNKINRDLITESDAKNQVMKSSI